MAKISQARKALKATKGYRKVGSTALGDFAKAPGESDRPAIDSGVNVDSIDAAFAPDLEPEMAPDLEPEMKTAAKPRGRSSAKG